MSEPIHVVVIDDDPVVNKAVSEVLKRKGHHVRASRDPLEGLRYASDPQTDVVVTDVHMPNVSGLALLKQLRSERPDVEVIVMTGHGTVETAMEAVRGGAYDFLLKPFEQIDVISHAVERAAERRLLKRKAESLQAELTTREQFEGMVGGASSMRAVFQMVETIASSSAPVLIHGETGTGKELIARALHHRSPRKNKPFIAVNCAALPETLVDSELFGHVKGSFTGASDNRRGLFEAANGGTLFLDEIGDVPLATQVRLLRALQEGEIKRVGATDVISVDVRIIAATHVSLEKARSEGKFRDDLFYRLSVLPITLPALRDRPEDIPALATHFLARASTRAGKKLEGFSPEVMDRLLRYRWSGNVRELENIIERLAVLSPGPRVEVDVLPPYLNDAGKPSPAPEGAQAALLNMPFAQAKALSVGAFERWYLTSLLDRSQGNVSAAALSAGMDRSNFRRLMKEHGLARAAAAEEMSA